MASTEYPHRGENNPDRLAEQLLGQPLADGYMMREIQGSENTSSGKYWSRWRARKPQLEG